METAFVCPAGRNRSNGQVRLLSGLLDGSTQEAGAGTTATAAEQEAGEESQTTSTPTARTQPRQRPYGEAVARLRDLGRTFVPADQLWSVVQTVQLIHKQAKEYAAMNVEGAAPSLNADCIFPLVVWVVVQVCVTNSSNAAGPTVRMPVLIVEIREQRLCF